MGDGEDVILFTGSQAYVPRLVQANVPWNRPPMPTLKYSTKRDTGGSLRTLGSDTYAPSGVPLRPEELLNTVKPTQKKEFSVATLGGARKVTKEGSFGETSRDSKDSLKDLVAALERKPRA